MRSQEERLNWGLLNARQTCTCVHLGTCSYSLKGYEWLGARVLGIFNDFAVVHPVGALDDKARIRQIAAEPSRGLVDDLRRFCNDVRALR